MVNFIILNALIFSILNKNLIQNYLKPFRITWQRSSRELRKSILFWCSCLVCVEICPIRVPPHPFCPSSRTVPIWFDNLFWWKSVVFSPLSSPLSALAGFFFFLTLEVFPCDHGSGASDGNLGMITASPASPPVPRSAHLPRGTVGPCTIGSLKFHLK